MKDAADAGVKFVKLVNGAATVDVPENAVVEHEVVRHVERGSVPRVVIRTFSVVQTSEPLTSRNVINLTTCPHSYIHGQRHGLITASHNYNVPQAHAMNHHLPRSVVFSNNNYYYYYYYYTTSIQRPFSRTTRVSRHQKGKPFWILLEQEMTGWQWRQPDHLQIISTSLQIDNHASTSPLSVYRSDVLPVAQHQSTEGLSSNNCNRKNR